MPMSAVRWFCSILPGCRLTPRAARTGPTPIVPFGVGWLEVPVDLHSKVRSIRLSIDNFWAMGGGLNEIQAYASPAP